MRRKVTLGGTELKSKFQQKSLKSKKVGSSRRIRGAGPPKKTTIRKKLRMRQTERIQQNKVFSGTRSNLRQAKNGNEKKKK